MGAKVELFCAVLGHGKLAEIAELPSRALVLAVGQYHGYFFAICVCSPYQLHGAIYVGGSQPLSSPPRSPRIAQLERAVRSGDKRGLQQFWADVQKQGTPLIEAIPSDADHYLVTFIWRAQGPVRNVLLISGLSNESYWRDVLPGNTLDSAYGNRCLVSKLSCSKRCAFYLQLFLSTTRLCHRKMSATLGLAKRSSCLIH